VDNLLDKQQPKVAFNRTHQAIEAVKMLHRIKDDFVDNPKAMDYFYDLYEQTYCKGESLYDKEHVIGTMCVQVPDELIYAAGAVPVRLCNGFYSDDQIGAEFMPAKSCSLVKATLGMLDKKSTLPFADKITDIVLPATCDQKRKSSAMIRDMGYDVYNIEVPPVKESEEARIYWRSSIYKFALSLKKMTGKRITKASLKEALLKVADAQKAFRTLHELRKQAPGVFLGKDLLMVTNAYFFDKIENWTLAVNKLIVELEQRKEDNFFATQRRAPRILFTGSPAIFPNLKLPLLIEESGGLIVADETCSSNRMLNDMVAVDEWDTENMVASIADNYLKPCTCPIFTENDDRKRKLINMAKEFAVDGIVYQAFSGCQVYQMEHSSISKALQEAGVPMLFVESDYSPDDMGQLSTRIEAFIESLKARRRRKR